MLGSRHGEGPGADAHGPCSRSPGSGRAAASRPVEGLLRAPSPRARRGPSSRLSPVSPTPRPRGRGRSRRRMRRQNPRPASSSPFLPFRAPPSPASPNDQRHDLRPEDNRHTVHPRRSHFRRTLFGRLIWFVEHSSAVPGASMANPATWSSARWVLQRTKAHDTHDPHSKTYAALSSFFLRLRFL